MTLGLVQHCAQVFARRLEIKIVQRIGARLHLFERQPFRQVIAFAMIVDIRREIGNLVITGKLAMRAIAIGQHQCVFAIFMGKVVIDPFLFHQPADKIEIRLPILHAVFPFPITAAQHILEIGEALLAEKLFDDVGNFLVLKNAAIGSARQKPQPGAERRPISAVTQATGADITKPGHEAVEVAGAALVGHLQPDRHVLAQHLRDLDIGLLAEQFHVELEQPAQLLGRRHPAKDQHVLAQGRIDGDHSMFLRDAGHVLVSPCPRSLD